MKSSLFAAALTGMMFLFSLNVDAALYTYRYTGNSYTNVSGPYTTSDRITAEFTIDLPTTSNLPWASYTSSLVGSLVMSDGVRTLSWPSADQDKFPEFRFSTDSSGMPTEWQVAINSIIGDNAIFTYTSDCVFDGIGPACDFAAFNENNPTAFVSNNSGTWTVVPAMSSAFTASPNVLWPPNNKLVHVTVSPIQAGLLSCQITSVSSNELITTEDYQITGALTVDLRAKRLGKGGGRVYTIDVSCLLSGSPVTGSVTVTVPMIREIETDQGDK